MIPTADDNEPELQQHKEKPHSVEHSGMMSIPENWEAEFDTTEPATLKLEEAAAAAATSIKVQDAGLAPAPKRDYVQQQVEFFVVLDFEATCDKPNQPEPQEIIEFPLVLVDAATLQIVNEFHSYVRPSKHPHLSAFCSWFTGIQQRDMDEAPEFPEVFKQACTWLDVQLQKGQRSAAIVTCGDWDLRSMLPRQCHDSKVHDMPQIFKQWVNIKKTYSDATGKWPAGMKAMLNDLGLPLAGQHNSGLDDS